MTSADCVETLGVKRLGAKETARIKKCKVRFSIIKNNKAFKKKTTGRWLLRSCYVQA